jgi:hypothetical protein
MSGMRKGWYGQRFPRWHGDEAGRFLGMHGMTIYHQKRDENTKCDECWDELGGAYSPACELCSGSGYIVKVNGIDTLPAKKAFVAFTQPYGNFGNAPMTFKAGGQQERMSAYVYFDDLTGADVDAGDRLVVNIKNYRQELVVMNVQPSLASGGENMMWVCECASPINKSLGSIVG